MKILPKYPSLSVYPNDSLSLSLSLFLRVNSRTFVSYCTRAGEKWKEGQIENTKRRGGGKTKQPPNCVMGSKFDSLGERREREREREREDEKSAQSNAVSVSNKNQWESK